MAAVTRDNFAEGRVELGLNKGGICEGGGPRGPLSSHTVLAQRGACACPSSPEPREMAEGQTASVLAAQRGPGQPGPRQGQSEVLSLRVQQAWEFLLCLKVDGM